MITIYIKKVNWTGNFEYGAKFGEVLRELHLSLVCREGQLIDQGNGQVVDCDPNQALNPGKYEFNNYTHGKNH